MNLTKKSLSGSSLAGSLLAGSSLAGSLSAGSSLAGPVLAGSVLGWLEQAACRSEDGEIFFPPATGETRAQRRMRENTAKTICKSCEVRLQCLSQAVATDERYGIWGGLNDLERRALQRSA